MPVPVRRAMLDDIDKNKLSHDKKQSKTNVNGRLIFDKKVEKAKAFGDVDDEIRVIDISLDVEKIEPKKREVKEEFSILTDEKSGDVEIEKNVEVDLFVGDEPESGVEVPFEVEHENSLSHDEEKEEVIVKKETLSHITKKNDKAPSKRARSTKSKKSSDKKTRSTTTKRRQTNRDSS